MKHLTHPVFYVHGSYAHLPLGRLPRRDDPRTLRLENYLHDLPAVPDVCDWTAKVPAWPMYGNDSLGDCTCAAAAHMVQAWACNAAGCAEPSPEDVDRLYWETGRPPADHGAQGGPTDNGRYEIDVLNYWRQTGLGPDRIAAYVAVNPAHEGMVRAAIYLFGGVYTGIALPTTAQNQRVWDVVGDGKTGDAKPGSWGGHAVPYEAYDHEGVTLVTWGGLVRATWRFHHAYTDEVYAVVSPDWLTNARSPAGLDLEQLQHDLSIVSK